MICRLLSRKEYWKDLLHFEIDLMSFAFKSYSLERSSPLENDLLFWPLYMDWPLDRRRSDALPSLGEENAAAVAADLPGISSRRS